MNYTSKFLEDLLQLGDDWEITDIKTDFAIKEVDIFIKYRPNLSSISDGLLLHDYKPIRRIRHLDLVDFKLFINVKIPRLKDEKGNIRAMELKWADRRVSYSYLFESKVITLLEISKNKTRTADFFDISFDIVHTIMQRAVDRGLSRRRLFDVKVLGIDEKSFSNGHNYMTVLSDPLEKRVLDIIEGRSTEDAAELITWTLPDEAINNVQMVAMDMWKPFMNAVEETMPQAEILHDKFHVIKIINKKVDDVRKSEVQKVKELKKSKYVFLKNENSWTENQRLKFEELNEINTNTSKAWKIKENFKGIYEQYEYLQCLYFAENWIIDTYKSNIEPMIKAANTIQNHLKGIVNAAYRGLTNSGAENLNSKIQVVKSIARGFKNIEGYRNAILFYTGKLSMHPL
jgi:transposase